MSRDYSKAIIKGRLGFDPEVRVTPQGKTVASLRVATSRRNGDKDVTTWHRVVLWEKLADTARDYLKKGSEVLIEGRLEGREWEDKNGQKRETMEIIGNELVMIGKPEGAPVAAGVTAAELVDTDDGSDLPF